MRFDYLWDEPANTLLLRFQARQASQLCGLLVSSDSPDGQHWPLLGVALSPLTGRDEPEMIVLHVPLPDTGATGDAPVYLTVEPICGDGGYGVLAADRLALVRGTPPRGATNSYWSVDTLDPWAQIEVYDQPLPGAQGATVLRSPRSADTLYPAVGVAVDQVAVPVSVLATRETYRGGEAHVLRVKPSANTDATVQFHVLSATPEVCDALVAPEMRGGRPAAPLPGPLETRSLARASRDGAEFRVHSGAVEPDLLGDSHPTSTQFLDRLVVRTTPPLPLDLVLGDRAYGIVGNPLVLVDLGDGSLGVDSGQLQGLLSAKFAPPPSATSEPVGAPETDIGAPFVEVVRRTLVERITRAFPAAANLRPVHADALRSSPSLYQTLAWFDLGWLDAGQQAAIRQGYSPLRGEPDTLRQLCRTLVTQAQRTLLSRPLSDLNRARIEAWLTWPAASAREAAHHCVAVLGWEATAEMILLGFRPDPMHLIRPDDADLDHWRETVLARFATLHGLGLLRRGADDLLVEIGDMAAATERVAQDWQEGREVVESAQGELGFHPPLTLDAVGAATDTPRAHRMLVQTLQVRLLAGLSQVLDPGPATRLAEILAPQMAGRLNDDFRKLLSLVQRDNLAMPAFFANVQGAAEGGGGFVPSPFVPALLGEAESLSDWVVQRIEDMPLLRAWKAELRAQMTRRPPVHGEDVRRPL